MRILLNRLDISYPLCYTNLLHEVVNFLLIRSTDMNIIFPKYLIIIFILLYEAMRKVIYLLMSLVAPMTHWLHAWHIIEVVFSLIVSRQFALMSIHDLTIVLHRIHIASCNLFNTSYHSSVLFFLSTFRVDSSIECE